MGWCCRVRAEDRYPFVFDHCVSGDATLDSISELKSLSQKARKFESLGRWIPRGEKQSKLIQEILTRVQRERNLTVWLICEVYIDCLAF